MVQNLRWLRITSHGVPVCRVLAPTLVKLETLHIQGQDVSFSEPTQVDHLLIGKVDHRATGSTGGNTISLRFETIASMEDSSVVTLSAEAIRGDIVRRVTYLQIRDG